MGKEMGANIQERFKYNQLDIHMYRSLKENRVRIRVENQATGKSISQRLNKEQMEHLIKKLQNMIGGM